MIHLLESMFERSLNCLFNITESIINIRLKFFEDDTELRYAFVDSQFSVNLSGYCIGHEWLYK